MNREDVLSGVRNALAAALDIEPGRIRLEDRIIGDLGADSLDLLDLVFHLEQRFKVRIAGREIERRVREKLGGAPLEAEGVYTPAAVAGLRAALPDIPAEELHEGLTVADLPRAFRVSTMVNLVCKLLEEKGG